MGLRSWMSVWGSRTVMALALAWTAVGCAAPDCQMLCDERAAECGGAVDVCVTLCQTRDTAAATADCTSERDALRGCESANVSVCDEDLRRTRYCSLEKLALDECLNAASGS